jgi:hypothetical protein
MLKITDESFTNRAFSFVNLWVNLLPMEREYERVSIGETERFYGSWINRILTLDVRE